jgi:hypothetical protein
VTVPSSPLCAERAWTLSFFFLNRANFSRAAVSLTREREREREIEGGRGEGRNGGGGLERFGREERAWNANENRARGARRGSRAKADIHRGRDASKRGGYDDAEVITRPLPRGTPEREEGGRGGVRGKGKETWKWVKVDGTYWMAGFLESSLSGRPSAGRS